MSHTNVLFYFDIEQRAERRRRKRLLQSTRAGHGGHFEKPALEIPNEGVRM